MPVVRRYALAFFLPTLVISFSLSSRLWAQEERVWTSSVGTSKRGTVVAQDAGNIRLRVSENAAEITIPIHLLSKQDQDHAKLLWFKKQDQRQYEKVTDHLRNLQENPKTVEGLLLGLHNDIPESPYAGLWAAVANISADNNHKAASSILRNVIKRIEEQQEVDPERHSMTLASANNNLAVCFIKARRGDSATMCMVKAMESRPAIPTILLSNALTLNETATTAGSLISFSKSSTSRLYDAINNANSVGAGTKLASGWHYSLDFNLPEGSAGSEKIDGIESPGPQFKLLAQGSGFVAAPGIVLTSKNVVETTNYRGPKLLTVVTNPTASNYKSERVSEVVIQAVKSVVTGGQTSTSNTSASFFPGESIQTINSYTNYDYVRSQDGHAGAELAALRVSNLRITPLEVAESSPPQNSDCVVWGFGRGSGAVANGIQSEVGRVLEAQTINGKNRGTSGQFSNSRVIQTSSRVLGGNRGGPVLDKMGVVVGIAFDTPIGGTNANGWIFGSTEMRRWFDRNVQTVQLTDPTNNSGPEARRAALSNAVLPVFVWGIRDDSSDVFSVVTEGGSTNGGLSIRDGWCIACDGKGITDCLDCQNGRRNVGMKTFSTGIDPITGRPRTMTRGVTASCTSCSGSGNQSCRHCNAGRL